MSGKQNLWWGDEHRDMWAHKADMKKPSKTDLTE